MSEYGDIDGGINLIGISKIVNNDVTNKQMPLDEIEKQLIGGKLEPIAVKDPNQEYQRIIADVSEEAPLDGYEGPDNVGLPDYVTMSANASKPAYDGSSGFKSTPQPNQPAITPSTTKYQQARPAIQAYRPNPPTPQNNIEAAMQTYAGNNMPIIEDNEVELVAAMLEDISDIREELSDVNLDSIPKVDVDSPPEQIKRVHEMLRRKHAHQAGVTMGKELILLGAKGLGWIFNGKRAIGPVKPNLKNWHANVRPRLRKMRYETGSLVASVMNTMKWGPGARIALELIPSAILYSAAMNEQEDEQGYSADQMSEAFDDLQQFEPVK